jgi:xanthosine utilization system XapX-like protein
VEYLNNSIVVTALVAVIGLVGAYVGVRATAWLLTKKQGYPGEQAVEAALYPYAYAAIVTAFKLSEVARDELGKHLEGLDKKALADSVYALLPEAIPVGGYLVPIGVVKGLVGREQWEAIVQNAFDELMRIYRQNGAVLDEWLRERIAELEAQA